MGTAVQSGIVFRVREPLGTQGGICWRKFRQTYGNTTFFFPRETQRALAGFVVSRGVEIITGRATVGRSPLWAIKWCSVFRSLFLTGPTLGAGRRG